MAPLKKVKYLCTLPLCPIRWTSDVPRQQMYAKLEGTLLQWNKLK